MASQKDMLEIMGGHVFIFAHFLVPKSKLIPYFSFIEGHLQGCHGLLALSKDSPLCPCVLISFQARHGKMCTYTSTSVQNVALYQKTHQHSQGSFIPSLFFIFLNNCFPYFFLTNSADILYLKEITLAHAGVWVSRMAGLSQLELDGYCNYLGKRTFP